MSEVQQQHQENVNAVQQRIAARLEAEMSGEDPNNLPPGEEEDTPGAPTSDLDSVDGEGELSQDDDAEELDADTDEDLDEDDDDAPDDDESEDDADSTWEERYKDQQKYLQESREEVADLSEQVDTMRRDTAQRMAEITRASHEIEDRLQQTEELSQILLQGAATKLQQANSINLAQVPQEQYQQAQAFIQTAQREYQQALGVMNMAKQRREEARKTRLQREVAIAQQDLSGEFPDFMGETYPKLAEFAAKRGVNPEVFSSITDPGLIRIINQAMVLGAEPDTPTELVKKPKRQKRRSRSKPNTKATGSRARMRKADQRMHQAATVKDRQAAFLDKTRNRLEGER